MDRLNFFPRTGKCWQTNKFFQFLKNKADYQNYFIYRITLSNPFSIDYVISSIIVSTIFTSFGINTPKYIPNMVRGVSSIFTLSLTSVSPFGCLTQYFTLVWAQKLKILFSCKLIKFQNPPSCKTVILWAIVLRSSH